MGATLQPTAHHPTCFEVEGTWPCFAVFEKAGAARTEAVVKILPGRVRLAVCPRDKEGGTTDGLLGRMTKDTS